MRVTAGGAAAASFAGFLTVSSIQEPSPPALVASYCFAVALPALLTMIVYLIEDRAKTGCMGTVLLVTTSVLGFTLTLGGLGALAFHVSVVTGLLFSGSTVVCIVGTTAWTTTQGSNE